VSRVLFVTNDFPTRRGGIETFVLSLCEGMDPDEVVVYTSSMPGDLEHDAGLPFPVYRDPSSMLLPTPAVGRRVVEVMRRHGCDRVVFGASAPLGLLGRRLRRAGAKRIVALTHGHEVWWARVPVTRQLLRRIGDSVDVMTYVSEWSRVRIASALSAEAADRMVRLSPGVDTDVFHPGCGGEEVRKRHDIPLDVPVVVCTGRMVKRKGHEDLLMAWPRVIREVADARLLLVGDGPRRRRLEALVVALEVDDSVIFTGRVPQDELPAHFDAGDVFALLSQSGLFGLVAEAFGIVFLEAAACGLPVVAGRSGGTPEVAKALGTYAIDPKSAPQIAGALKDALATARLEGGAARGRIPKDWTWKSAAGRLRWCLCIGDKA
jgi:phosphatidylinositol alpha-1,6-mannosyltransferase